MRYITKKYIGLVSALILYPSLSVLAQPIGDSLVVLRGHRGVVFTAYFNLDGKQVVTAGSDSSVILWNADNGALERRFTEHARSVLHATFTPNGMVMSAGADSTIMIWDPATGQIAKRIATSFLPTCVDMSHDGSKIVAIDRFGPSMIFAANGVPLRPLSGSQASQFTARFSPDGRSIVTAGGRIKPRIWDVETGNELRELSGTTRIVYSVRYNSDGTRIIVAADRAALIYDAATGDLLTSFKDQHLADVHDASYSPDGQYVVTVSSDKTAKVWNVESGTVIRTLIGHSGELRTTGVFSPDGSRVLTASLDSTARIWFLQTSSVGRPETEISHRALRNYPNPVHSRTQVDFNVSRAGNARLAVYDMLGRELMVLIDEHMSAGDYSIELDASRLPSSSYFIVLDAVGERITHPIRVER